MAFQQQALAEGLCYDQPSFFSKLILSEEICLNRKISKRNEKWRVVIIKDLWAVAMHRKWEISSVGIFDYSLFRLLEFPVLPKSSIYFFFLKKWSLGASSRLCFGAESWVEAGYLDAVRRNHAGIRMTREHCPNACCVSFLTQLGCCGLSFPGGNFGQCSASVLCWCLGVEE